MPNTDGSSIKYTICLDLFTEEDLFDIDTATAKTYQQILVGKQTVQEHSLQQSPWIDRIWKEKDIFVPRTKTELHNCDTCKKFNLNLKACSSVSKRHIASVDYRFSAITVTPIDMDTIMNRSTPQKHPDSIAAGNLPFLAYNTRSIVNTKLCAEVLGYGVVRLFKDSENHLNLYKIDAPGMKHVSGDDTMVAILAVPFYFSASDLLLGFFEETDLPKLSHIRLIKSSEPNRFMILLKFREKQHVAPFIKRYQGRRFNSFEPETCSVVEVKEIVFRPKQNDTESVENVKVALPYLLEDPFTNDLKLDNEKSQLPSTKYTELATCPVCLERLDSSVTGLLTIPCQHTFHCSCLSKWKDDTCPVCRYSSRIKGKGNLDNDASLSSIRLDSAEVCFGCQRSDNLWICLICGNVGCGRYDEKHAIKHWEETGHCFAMQIDTQRVWDYAEDGYVHRLVQNEADGKLVELPLRDESKKSTDEKVDKIGFEYSKMLIAQLESQREYYENMLTELRHKLNLSISSDLKFKENMAAKMEIFEKKLAEMNKQKETETRLTDSLRKDYAEVKVLNDAYRHKITLLEEQNEAITKEKEELKEQVTDLMFFLESQEKFKNASDEVKEGQIVMVPKKSKKSGKRR